MTSRLGKVGWFGSALIGALLAQQGLTGCSSPSRDFSDGGAGESSQAGTAMVGEDRGAGAAPVEMPTAVAGESNGGGPTTGVGGVGGESGAAVTPVAQPVSGQVLAGVAPLEGAVILVDGVKVVTDKHGQFTVADAPASYDLVVHLPTAHRVSLYEGMTSRTLNINVGRVMLDKVERSCSLNGNVTGGVALPIPNGADVDQVVAFQFSQDSDAGGYSFSTPKGYYSTKAYWFGETEEHGTLFALQTRIENDLPAEFLGFARKDLTLYDGQTLGDYDNGSPATNLVLVDPPEFTVSGKLTAPANWTVNYAYLHVGPIQLQAALQIGDFSVLLPKVDAPISIDTNFFSDGYRSASLTIVPPEKGPWNIDVPNGPDFGLPPDQATDVDATTEFTWAKSPSLGVTSVTWLFPDLTVVRMTMNAKTTLPDLAQVGVELPKGAAGTWALTSYGPAQNTDEGLVAESALLAANGTPVVALQVFNRKFTSAP